MKVQVCVTLFSNQVSARSPSLVELTTTKSTVLMNVPYNDVALLMSFDIDIFVHHPCEIYWIVEQSPY